MTIELNIALMPTKATSDQLVALSKTLAHRYPTIVQLDPNGVRLALAPHLTLYQVPLTVQQLEAAAAQLKAIAARTHLTSLRATQYAYNAHEASFELQRETADQLVILQHAILDSLNALRGSALLQRDPSGTPLTAALKDNSPLGDNIRTYGYAEIGPLFRPHDTLNWFKPGTDISPDTEELPAPETISGDYEAIGMFALGPHGTCPQLIDSYPLAV